MKSIIPNDSRYIPFTQQKWCCVPACIQMIMYRHKIPLVPQELIGFHLGLIVPEEDSELFYNIPTGTKPDAGYGTRISLPEYEPNQTFKKLGLPFTFKQVPIEKFNSIEEVKEYLHKKVEQEDIDILTNFDVKTFYGDEYPSEGHVCLIDKVDLNNNTVRMINPSFLDPKWENAELGNLIYAMKVHSGSKGGGFWEIEVTPPQL